MTRRFTTTFAAALLLAALITSAGRADRLRNLQLGGPVPAFSLPALAGGQIDSDSFHGRPILLLILATDQPNSQHALLAAAQTAARLANPDLAVLAVTADTDHEGYFRQFWQDSNLDIPLGLDYQRKLYGDLGVIVLPTTLVIDRQGKLAHVLSSYRPDYPVALEAYARHALGLLTDQQLQQTLTATAFEHNAPADRAARHRAAADLLRQKADLDAARAELEKAAALDSTNPDVQLDLADLDLAQGQLNAADTRLHDVFSRHPNHRRARLLLGILHFKRGNLDEAQSTLLDALQLNPNPARAHYYLGRIYQLRGDKDQALAHYHAALQTLLGEEPPPPVPQTQPLPQP